MNTRKNIFEKPRKKNKSDGSVSPKSMFENRDKFLPKEETEIVFYHADVKSSRRCKEHEFLNHLNGKLLMSNQVIIDKFKDDLSYLHEYFDITPEDTRINKRLRDIFSLYISLSDLEKLDRNIYKARIKDEAGAPTGFRIFIFKDFETNQFKIFLLDPLHLVITSHIQRKEKTYINNRGNSMCLSELFED